MPVTTREGNRGPAAAADNHRAILASARRLFAERGYHVPLNAIARDAGVGQGVLYRHFPSRFDLAFAVFEENFAELEALADDPAPDAFARVWSRLLDLTVREAAFVEMVVEARRSRPEYDGGERLRALIEPPLLRAQDAGLVDPLLGVDDVLLAQRMAYGIVVTELDPASARQVVERALGHLARPVVIGPNRGDAP
ncbi:TetR/AcrR family transcriptional regulator [Nocardioides ferulae]|uniref:TetR/AcrR family transcriptional regulator n=1 Tax=Nocardioides ferulae TaxID=2340821 RepID=UPI000EAF1F11|nr:TetR/AcrR family transcriptional regulator [Nocardioides ferulae]